MYLFSGTKSPFETTTPAPTTTATVITTVKGLVSIDHFTAELNYRDFHSI